MCGPFCFRRLLRTYGRGIARTSLFHTLVCVSPFLRKLCDPSRPDHTTREMEGNDVLTQGIPFSASSFSLFNAATSQTQQDISRRCDLDADEHFEGKEIHGKEERDKKGNVITSR